MRCCNSEKTSVLAPSEGGKHVERAEEAAGGQKTCLKVYPSSSPDRRSSGPCQNIQYLEKSNKVRRSSVGSVDPPIFYSFHRLETTHPNSHVKNQQEETGTKQTHSACEFCVLNDESPTYRPSGHDGSPKNPISPPPLPFAPSPQENCAGFQTMPETPAPLGFTSLSLTLKSQDVKHPPPKSTYQQRHRYRISKPTTTVMICFPSAEPQFTHHSPSA